MAEGDGRAAGLPAVSGGGRGKYVTWSPELETAILERVAAGESVLSVCRDAGMPHPTTVYAWRDERPGFGAALAEAQRTARVAARMAERAAAAARLAAGRDGRGRWSTYTPEMGEAVCRRIAGGESLAAIGRDPDMPCAATILNWAREFPEFGDRYALARSQMADWLFDEAREVSLAATPSTVWVGRLRFDTIRWMTARMAPKKYCERILAEAEAAALRAEAAEAAGAGGGEGRRVVVEWVHFRKGPNGEVLVAPPRDAREEADWERAYGKPYDGPR